ncbi:translocation/assembly module TamB domain-containing protein [Rickettsiella massiliensis]|uniref:translocation/assembly module TamB domain-containing protein n=1 Tax=Rickettsiella massiliensis TaxID=676517 RepID=UPI00029ABF34
MIIRKKFSPRLDVSYSVGLLEPINILQINYLLNKHFSLQATNSSFASGIDLIYNFEK